MLSRQPDDPQYTALTGLYGNITAPSLSETGNQCQITGCGQQCPNGYDSLTTLTQIPNVAGYCDPYSPARLCCPPGNEPQNCQWRGGGGTTCNAQCNVGEIVMALDEVGNDGYPTCIQGYKAFCCQSGSGDPGACFGTCKWCLHTYPLIAFFFSMNYLFSMLWRFMRGWIC